MNDKNPAVKIKFKKFAKGINFGPTTGAWRKISYGSFWLFYVSH